MKLIETIKKNGIENCIFLIPMKPVRTVLGLISYTSSSDEDFVVPAEICEERYKVSENYKITLKSIYKGFGKEHLYVMDLEQLIDQGTVQFFVRASTNKQK